MGRKSKNNKKNKGSGNNKQAEAASADLSDVEATVSEVETTTYNKEGEGMEFERRHQTQSSPNALKRNAIRSFTDEDTTGILSDHNIDYRKTKVQKR